MRRWLSGVLAAVLLATGAYSLGAQVGRTQAEAVERSAPARRTEGVARADGSLLLAPEVTGGDAVAEEDRLAVALVVGITRPHDATLFGEFAKRRAADACPGTSSGDFRFARMHIGGQPAYRIHITDATGSGCGFVVADLDWETAEVSPPRPSTDAPPEAVDWLTRFPAGEGIDA